MAATRENVLAAISQYVLDNNRRAPASAIADIVSDNTVNVQNIIKTLVAEGSINSSRGRNGGSLPDGHTLAKKPKAAKAKVATESAESDKVEESSNEDTASQFAALLAKLDAEEASTAVKQDSSEDQLSL
jgi:DNA-binding IscR family transcriptional regulator